MPIFGPKKSESYYSDVRGGKADPERQAQPKLDWYMEQYPVWRSLFEGTALEEKLSAMKDLSADTDQEDYRWPVRFNLIKSYCLLYAGLLWGRGTTGKDANKLFDVRIDPKVPGRPGPDSFSQAERLKDYLDYFWAHQFQVIRPNSAIQQWAGGCIIKAHWNPYSPSSVYGVQLQTVQPEHFYPVWNPTNFEELLAAKVKFSVSQIVAKEIYGMTDAELAEYAEKDGVRVEEHWDRREYAVVLGRGRKGPKDPGVIAKIRGPNGKVEELAGPNLDINPRTGLGVIPLTYIPRIRVGSFFGLSLAYDLEGTQQELNKTLADFGDALTRGAHPPFGISDYRGPGSKKNEPVIMLPRSGALNMGMTSPDRQPPKVHEFPEPTVPPETGNFTDRLLALSEVSSGLTAAARGASDSGKSGVAMAMELLPTTNMIDWERSHWSAGITGPQGINEILAAMWYSRKDSVPNLPTIDEGMFHLRQHLDYRPVMPRDRAEIIDEVVRLATAKAVSPQEWLRRLGDIPDLEKEYIQLFDFLAHMVVLDSAVAGRPVKLTRSANPEEPALATPQIAGQTEKPKSKQPAKQPEGQKPPRE